jgi:hypothetical protein
MVTNLFKPLSRPTGEFFLFSNYADDLTRQATTPKTYRVVPSKFAALNLDTSNVASITETASVATGIATALQDYYENKTNFLHTYNDYPDNIEYKKWWDSRIIWQTLLKFGLIHLEDYQEVDDQQNPVSQFKYFPELQYIGDVNIYSTTENDGRAYNEIYCYIPNDAQKTNYSVQNIGDYNESFVYTDIPGTLDGNTMTLIGWNHDNYPENIGIANSPLLDDTDNVTYNIYDSGDPDDEHDDGMWFRPDALACEWSEGQPDFDDQSTNLYATADDVMFEVNSILVFYDVISINDDGTETVKYKNLPLGIYFTGYEDDALCNVIEKYVNSDDIYQQGTSYGLRICNRFVSTPNATTFYDTNVDMYDGLADFSHAMQLMGENAVLMSDIAEQNRITLNSLNDHLAQFKNYRTNVPYIRQLTINGDQVGVWFVNGRNTGQIAGTYMNRATQSDWDCEDVLSPAYIQNRPDLVTLRGIVMDEDVILTHTDNKGLGIEAGTGITLTHEHREPTDEIPYEYESIVINGTGGGGGSDLLKVETTPIHTFDDHSSVLFKTTIPYEAPKSDVETEDEPKVGYVCEGNNPNNPTDDSNTSLEDFAPGSDILYYTVQVPENAQWESGKKYRIAIHTGGDLLISDQSSKTLVLRFNNHNLNVSAKNPEVVIVDEALNRISNTGIQQKTLYAKTTDISDPDNIVRYPLILYIEGLNFNDAAPIGVNWPPDIVYFDITFVTEPQDDTEVLTNVLLDMGWGNSGNKESDPQISIDPKNDAPIIKLPK